jgi:hypothetical protein
MQVWHKDLLARIKGMAHDGVGLDFACRHGEKDAHPTSFHVRLEVP